MNMERNQIIAQRTAFGEALCELGAEYENLVVLDPDVGPSTKTALFAKTVSYTHLTLPTIA